MNANYQAGRLTDIEEVAAATHSHQGMQLLLNWSELVRFGRGAAKFSGVNARTGEEGKERCATGMAF